MNFSLLGNRNERRLMGMIAGFASTLVFLSVGTAHATEVKKIDHFHDLTLAALHSEYQDLLNQSVFSSYGFTYTFQATADSQNTNSEDLIKQALHQFAPDYSDPEWISVQLLQDRSQAQFDKAMEHLVYGDDVSNGDNMEAYQNLEVLLMSAFREPSRFELYVGAEGNSFGGTDFVVIKDLTNGEYLLLAMGYAE